MEKVLLTGAAGFIGMHTCLKLLDLGYAVVGIDNINEYYDKQLKFDRLAQLGPFTRENVMYNRVLEGNAKFKFVQIDITDPANLERLFFQEKFDYVIHLAAQAGVRYSIDNPRVYIDSNITGFFNILEACRHNKIKHLVYASSSSVYGLNQSIPFKESDHADHPASVYAATKKSNESMAHTYSQLFDIPMTGLRFFTVYGPWGRPDMAPFKFTKAILEERSIQVYNHGKMQRDFTYVKDIVEGVCGTIKAIPQRNKHFNHHLPNPDSSSAPYAIYNIGNSQPVNLMDFIEAIEKATGKKAKKEMLPMQPGDVTKTFAATQKLEDKIGYKPNTPLQEGIDEFVKWYVEYFKVDGK
ncbi:NAD-dependent epimerase [Flexithrix dorotheae]|uniref:NAD-dependent epimerase n=1 Tax=Flexithrix dorotheae TaxID=70993 RepID=UPI0003698441|nr:NAD-dependent epimerase [Flexithrix dorotheae]